MGAEIIDIACELRGETDKAYRIFDGKTTEWVAKSQVELEREPGATTYVCTMPVWMAKEKGFI